MDIKRVIRLVIFCAMACFSAALQHAAEINGLVGEYYANRTLEGQPVYRLDEKSTSIGRIILRWITFPQTHFP